MTYFFDKLKVKDLMVRMPVTVDVNDTVEETLIKGRGLTMSTFSVMDGDKAVGVVSDREIFVTLFRLLEAGTDRFRGTLSDVTLEEGTLTELLRIVDATGGTARSIFMVSEGKNGKVRVVLRADSNNPDAIRRALEERGLTVLEFHP